MIDVTYLYCGVESSAVAHRYGQAIKDKGKDAFAVAPDAASRKPIVVWNVTRTCNLRCVHCYSDSANRKYPDELTTAEGEALIDDVAQFGVPVLLFSGGEPLARRDTLDLIARARGRGLRVSISTNGTLIDPPTAERIHSLGVTYVGVSLDGIGEANDRFRGVPGAYDRALTGIRNLIACKQKVGLRLTITRQTVADLPALFDLMEREGIPRVCFYHLVPSGRGKEVTDLNLEESRRAVETILSRTRELVAKGGRVEVLTVDNPCDGPFLLRKLQEEKSRLAESAEAMLRWNGGGLHGPGIGIACVSFNGDVHPDQFWRHEVLGNVRERPFSAVWSDPKIELLAKLRERRKHIHGRCRDCGYFEMCGGGFRARAAIATGDAWAADPACYLTDDEIAQGRKCNA